MRLNSFNMLQLKRVIKFLQALKLWLRNRMLEYSLGIVWQRKYLKIPIINSIFIGYNRLTQSSNLKY